MARESNVDKLKDYRSKVDYARRWRQRESYDNLWSRMINLYRGKQYRGKTITDRMLVNICFSTINTLAPAVSIGRPKILVSPRRPEDGDKAVVTEAIINYWWQHYDCQPEFQRSVKDYLILGHGWVKTGYRFVEEEKLDEIDLSADEAATKDPTGEVESTFIIREDRPFLERINPFDMYVDPNATSMNDMRWIAQCIRRPLKDVKNDTRYNYAARQDVNPNSYGSIYAGNGVNNPGGMALGSMNVDQYSTSADEAYADIYEYYNIDTGEMSIFADSTGDKFLVKPVKMPYKFGHPFFMLRNYDIPGFFYPMGELEAIEPLQYELNETRTQMMNHRKRYSRKWLFKESAFDDFGRNALTSDEDNAIVPVKGDENLQNVVVPMPALINPPDFYNQSELITNDIDRVSGVSEYQRGTIPETTRTAREATIIADAGNARVAEKLVSIENSIAHCAANLIMLAQQYLTGEQTVRIVGSENAPIWLTFDKDYISGEFDFMVEAGSTAPRNESFRRDMALQIVSALQPFAQAGIVNLPKLAEYVLGTGFGVKNPQAFLQEPPAPEGMEGMPPGMEGMPPGMEGMPPGMEGMPPEGMEGIPPELQEALAQGGQAPPPEAMEGMPPELLAAIQGQSQAPSPEGLPPDLAGLPPELLAALQGQAPAAQDVPPDLAGLPPELLAALQGQAPQQ